jgi:hypothetical protein
MDSITLSSHNIQKMLQDYAAIDMLSHQLEKVLDYYEEHPQYPLDINKLRKTVMEVHARNAEAATRLSEAAHDHPKHS